MVKNANDIQPNHQPTLTLASRDAHW